MVLECKFYDNLNRIFKAGDYFYDLSAEVHVKQG